MKRMLSVLGMAAAVTLCGVGTTEAHSYYGGGYYGGGYYGGGYYGYPTYSRYYYSAPRYPRYTRHYRNPDYDRGRVSIGRRWDPNYGWIYW